MNNFTNRLKMSCWDAPDSDTGFEGLDIFSMDFEGSSEQASQPEVSAPAAEGAPAEPSNPSVQQEAPEPNKTDEPEAPAAQGTAPVEEPGSEPESPVASAPQPAGPTAEELLAQALQVNQKLAEQLKAAAAPVQPSQPEEDEDTKVFAERKPQDYLFNINPQLYEGLFGADATQEQRIQCLQAYASGIATVVHNNILKTLGAWTKQNFEAVPGAIKYIMNQTNQASQTSAQIREGFYSAYPDLKKPELFPLIKATIQAVQKETQAKAWTQDFAAKVAGRVRSVLSGYAQATKPQAAALIITPAAAKPAPKPVETNPNGTDEILATLISDF